MTATKTRPSTAITQRGTLPRVGSLPSNNEREPPCAPLVADAPAKPLPPAAAVTGEGVVPAMGEDVLPSPSPAGAADSLGTGAESSGSPAGRARGTTRVASLRGGAPTPAGATTGGADSGRAATGGADNGLGTTGGGVGRAGAPVG